MAERLPSYIDCPCCGRTRIPIENARRKVVAWVRAGEGGSLSNPKGQHFPKEGGGDSYRCNSCVFSGCVDPGNTDGCRVELGPSERARVRRESVS